MPSPPPTTGLEFLPSQKPPDVFFAEETKHFESLTHCMTDPHKNSTVKKVNFKLRNKKTHCFNIVVFAAGKSRESSFQYRLSLRPRPPSEPYGAVPGVRLRERLRAGLGGEPGRAPTAAPDHERFRGLVSGIPKNKTPFTAVQNWRKKIARPRDSLVPPGDVPDILLLSVASLD